MRNIFFCQFTLLFACLFAFNANAQQKSGEETVILKKWDAVWQAYEKGDEAAMWSFYAENACEVYPDGSSICGLQAMKAGYEQFKGMLEGKPSWAYTTPSVHLIEPNVALLLADVTSDMKLKGGQQIGGKMKFSAVLHKVNGNWLIAFDSQTPVMQMPGN